jgi:uncharacterized protein YdhG (YjbR/CyaY superfamily)
MDSLKFNTVGEYIATYPENKQQALQLLRSKIIECAPQAIEAISYNMPAFRYMGKILVYYAAHTEHIGFYPASTAVQTVFAKELKDFGTSKGTIRLPLKDPIPLDLIEKIILYRMRETEERIKSKKKK